MLTSAHLLSKTQSIASQHSGPSAERLRERGEEKRSKKMERTHRRRERGRVESEFNLISYCAEAGWAMVSSIIYDAHPRSGCGRRLHLCPHTSIHVSIHTHIF